MPNPAGPRAADSAPTQPGASPAKMKRPLRMDFGEVFFARNRHNRERQPARIHTATGNRAPRDHRPPRDHRTPRDRRSPTAENRIERGGKKPHNGRDKKKRGEEKDKPEEFRSSDATSPFLRPFLSFANRRRGRDPRFAGTKVRKFFHRPRRTRSPEAKLFGLDHQSIDLDHQCIGHETRKDRHRAANDLPPPPSKKTAGPPVACLQPEDLARFSGFSDQDFSGVGCSECFDDFGSVFPFLL